jgi:hypothetical protein
MANPKAVNEKREELKEGKGPSGQGSATAEERELAKADGGPAARGEARAATTKEAALPEDGTRVWNHWDDGTARDLQLGAEREAAEKLGIALEDARDADGPTGPTGPTGTTGATGRSGPSGGTGSTQR